MPDCSHSSEEASSALALQPRALSCRLVRSGAHAGTGAAALPRAAACRPGLLPWRRCHPPGPPRIRASSCPPARPADLCTQCGVGCEEEDGAFGANVVYEPPPIPEFEGYYRPNSARVQRLRFRCAAGWLRGAAGLGPPAAAGWAWLPVEARGAAGRSLLLGWIPQSADLLPSGTAAFPAASPRSATCASSATWTSWPPWTAPAAARRCPSRVRRAGGGMHGEGSVGVQGACRRVTSWGGAPRCRARSSPAHPAAASRRAQPTSRRLRCGSAFTRRCRCRWAPPPPVSGLRPPYTVVKLCWTAAQASKGLQTGRPRLHSRPEARAAACAGGRPTRSPGMLAEAGSICPPTHHSKPAGEWLELTLTEKLDPADVRRRLQVRRSRRALAAPATGPGGPAQSLRAVRCRHETGA